MKKRYVGLMVAQTIVIILLLAGVVVLVILLNGSATIPLTSLPKVPTFDPVFVTETLPASPAEGVTDTSQFVTSAPPQTELPILILNGTPIFRTPTATSIANNPIPFFTLTPTPLSATVWTYTPAPFIPTVTAQQGTRPCRNILYPVVTGQQWQYQSSAVNRTDIISMNVTSVGSSRGDVTINNQTTGTSKQVLVQCEGDIIRSFPSMSLDALFGSALSGDMTANYVSGVLAPNEAAFLNTNWALAWSSNYLVTGTAVVSRNDTQVSVSLNDAPVSLTCQTLATGDAAFENITVPAGTFRALKVICTAQGHVTAVVNGVSVSGTVEGQSFHWFAPYVGQVKMQVTAALVRVFDIPFTLSTDSTLNLIGYNQVP